MEAQLKRDELTRNLTRHLFDVIRNYEITLINQRDILKQLVFILYDVKMLNELEMEALYLRIDKADTKELLNNLDKLF